MTKPTILDKTDISNFAGPVSQDLDEFDRRLNDHLRGDSPLITSLARHLLKTKGKRLRPVFAFLSSHATDNFSEHSVDASLAIELIHTATLLHDDVVDESELRRGQETVNHKWTNLISVLMGDYLFAKAFRVMVATGSLELVDAISRATERVSVGELRQIEETGNYDLSEGEYLDIIADKTASLFAVSCEAGPILQSRPSVRKQFAEFGENVGRAFQIIDDLLDFVGDAEVTGKEPGNDVRNGKVTLPLIYSLKQVGDAAKKEIVSLFEKDESGGSFEDIYSFVQENGGIDYAYRKADELCSEGLDILGKVKDSAYSTSLNALVQFTVARAS